MGDILRSVVATANSRRDGLLPTDVDGVRETFADDLDLLATLQLKWHTRLAGRIERQLVAQPLDLLATLQLKWHTRLAGHIERQLVAQPLDLPLAVATAWCEAREELPGVRLVLDRYRAEPVDDAMARAMTVATRKERALLAVMAGQASVGHEAEAAVVGARIEERARAMRELAVVTEAAAPAPSFLERLRSVLAA